MSRSKALAAGRVAYAAGFRDQTLVLAIAIAGAESAWEPSRIGDEHLVNVKWGPSLGLWQIRSLKPKYLHLEPVRDGRKLLDPQFNADAAYQISSGGVNWTPWSAYTNNTYADFIDEATTVVQILNSEGLL